MKAGVLVLALVAASATTAVAQTPRLSNGRLEHHAVRAGLAKDLPALAATLADPTWIGYAVPVIDGEHDLCDWTDRVRRADPAGPVLLEPADYFFVLYRVEGGQVARIRSYSAGCPLDGGGKAVHWFTNVTTADSLSYLNTIVVSSSASSRMVDSAITALAMHAGQAALDGLIGFARHHANTRVRGSALFWLAQRAGQKAVGTIASAIEDDPDTEVKKKAVFALSQLPRDQGVPLLILQARTNKNPAVRKQAMFWLGQSKDARALKFFAEVLK